MVNKSNIILTVNAGLLFMLLGVLIVIKPIKTLELLILYFSLAVGIRGLYLLYLGLKSKTKSNKNSWVIFNGLIDISFGLVLFAHPAITLEILPFIVGFWALLSGLLESAIAATTSFKQSWPQFLFGNVIFLFGWFILLHPYFSGILFSDLFGGLLIFMGLSYIFLSIMFEYLFSE